MLTERQIESLREQAKSSRPIDSIPIGVGPRQLLSHIDALQAEVDRLTDGVASCGKRIHEMEAIIDRLPKTADDEYPIPGRDAVFVFEGEHVIHQCVDLRVIDNVWHADCGDDVIPVTSCWATYEAAAEAQRDQSPPV